MPQVPTYDNLRVATSDAPMPGFQPASGPSAGQIAGQQLQQLGAGLESAGGVAGKIAADMQQQANDLRVNDAMNQYMTAQTNARVEVLKLKGKDALERPDNKSLPDEYGEKMDQIVSDLGGKLGNAAQRQSFNAAAQRQGIQFRGAVSQHMVQQAEVYADQTDKAALDTAVNRGTLLWGDKEALDGSRAAITRAVDAIAKRKGMGTEARDMALVESMTPLHMGVMKSMITAGQASEAKRYYDENSAGMTLQARVNMQDTLKGAVVAEVAQTRGADIAARYDYTQTGAAIKEIDALSLPPEQKVAIRAEVEHRHAVQQSDANVNNALMVGKLDTMVQQGMSAAAIQATPEFQSVRDKGTTLRAIRERTEHAVSLQAAVESRDYTRVQRLRAEQEYKGQVAKFAYSDPAVLSSMRREDVAALTLTLGPSNTHELLQRFDSIAKSPEKLREAKMDHDQFNVIAKSVGVDSFSPKTDSEKEAVSTMRDRVNGGIDLWQRAHGNQEMPRPEKEKLMREMISIEVLTRGKVYGTNTTNAAGVSEADLKNVVVPPSEVPLIVAHLRGKRGDPEYNPTPEELGRTYIQKKQADAAKRVR